MVLEQDPNHRIVGDDPPFLTEPTRLVQTELSNPRFPRLVDLADRWRPGVAALMVPAIAIAGALAYLARADVDDASQSADGRFATTADDSESSDEVADVDRSNRRANEGPSSFVEPVPVDGFVPDPSPAPPTTRSPVTTATEPPPSTTTAPPSTTASTPQTTAQPPDPTVTTPSTPTTSTTVSESTTVTEPEFCQALVAKSSKLFTEPDKDSDDLGRIPPGLYTMLGSTDGWYQVDAEGVRGWIKAKRVAEVVGDC